MFDIKCFKNDELAIFAGAGVSNDSGLPLANELKLAILMALTKNKEDINLVMNSKVMPFELFIQNLTTNVSERVFKIFSFGRPNANHILIAKLAKIGKIKVILTTNFDLLFERAMDEERVSYTVYYLDNDFSNLDFKNLDNSVRIFKIHGSIDNYDSLINTIYKVGRTPTPEKEAVLDYLFRSGTHDRILVMGYSCSDIFDINPYLSRLKGNCKDIIFLEHAINKPFNIEHLSKISSQHPFSRFNGFKVRCITNTFIQDLWQIFEENIGEYTNHTNKIKWDIHIKNWAKSLNYGQKEAILGKMFVSISNFCKAEEYYNSCLKIAERHKIPYPLYHCNLELCGIYQEQGYLNKALSYCKKALDATKHFPSEFEKTNCNSTLGRIYAALKEYDRAIEYLVNSLNYYESHGDEHSISKTYMTLGICYRGVEKQDEAIMYINKSLHLKKKYGDIEGISKCYSNLGSCYHSKKDHIKAIECYEIAATGFSKLGMMNHLSKTYWCIGVQYNQLRDFEKESLYITKSKETASNITYVESSETEVPELYGLYELVCTNISSFPERKVHFSIMSDQN